MSCSSIWFGEMRSSASHSHNVLSFVLDHMEGRGEKKKCSSSLQELGVIAGEARWHSWDTSRGCRVWVSAVCWVVQLCPLFATPLTVAHQASLSMGFSRQEYWSGLPCSPPRDLPNSGIEPECLMSAALADEFLTTGATWESLNAL